MLGMQVSRSAVVLLSSSCGQVQDLPGNNSASKSPDNPTARSAHIRMDRPLAHRFPNCRSSHAKGVIEIDRLMSAKPINSNHHPSQSLRDTVTAARPIS